MKDNENAPLWVRDEYNCSTKKYIIYRYDDVCHWSERKGDIEIYTEE